MTKLSKEETKMMYELAKIANPSRQLSDDFQQSIVLFMFKDYLSSIPNGEAFLLSFMDQWEAHVINQKVDELNALTNQNSTMFDMAAGAGIANSENVEEFKLEVKAMKELFTVSLMEEE